VKLLIATPAYGGMVTTGYLTSIVPVMQLLREEGVHVELYTLSSESLIPRGRNTCIQRAIDGYFDKVLFIDADLTFTYEKVKMLLNSDKDLVGGTYPLKAFPICPNFNPLEDQRDLFGLNRQQDNYMQWVNKYADTNGEAEVLHIPTGFMLIDMKVFAKLSHVVPWYQTFQPETKQHRQHFDFFLSGVKGHEYESEDWAFCRIARENGFKVYLQTRAICGHIGNITYGLGSHIIIGQEPLIR
jgi:hypothetical protein